MDLRKVHVVLQDDRVLHDRLVNSSAEQTAQNGMMVAIGDGLVPSDVNDLNFTIQGLLKVFGNGKILQKGSSTARRLIFLSASYKDSFCMLVNSFQIGYPKNQSTPNSGSHTCYKWSIRIEEE